MSESPWGAAHAVSRTELHATLVEIADALSDPPPAWIPSGRAEAWREVRGASLWRGSTGLALMFSTLGECGFGEEYDRLAIGFLERAREVASRRVMNPSLYRGFVGIGWTTTYLAPRLLEDPPARINQEIDAALLDLLGRTTWSDHYELWNGLVGIGMYGLSRAPLAVGREIAARVIGHLDRLAVRDKLGTTWTTSPAVLKSKPGKSPDQCNLGLAHGLPCFISFLARALEEDVASETVEPLLESSVRWLLSQRESGPRKFSSWVRTGSGERYAGPNGWCYGDLGVAMSLLRAGRARGERSWEEEAVSLALPMAERSPFPVRDAGFCHGASGFAHMFRRLHQATGCDAFEQAADSWIEKVLELRRTDVGVGGYAAWNRTDEDEFDWLDDPGIVQGAAGVVLTLLSAACASTPKWDSFLLTDLA